MNRTQRTRVVAKPSQRLKDAKVRVIGGPMDGQTAVYAGRAVRVRVSVDGRIATGEYRLSHRPLGERRGYEPIYEWFGPTPNTADQQATA